MQEPTKEQEKALENFKAFFMADMKIKETIFKLAPNELDDYNEESRIEYTDKLYKELKNLEIEFIEIAKRNCNEPKVIETIQEYFKKSRQDFLISKYKPGVINKLYQKQFSSMDEELIENVKSEFHGYKLIKGDIEKCINQANSINELLHIFHSYLINNNNELEKLPLINTKQNTLDMPISLYGEETELSKELFKEFPIELDCDEVDIVSLKDKILLMVRSRGHALTIDIDTKEKENALVKYFVPKICNKEMVEALPGVNKKGISENGATGLFQISSAEFPQKLFEFIEKVPTDLDNPYAKITMKEPIYEYTMQDSERIKFQEKLREGIVETPRVDINKINEEQRITEITREEEIGE